MKLTMIATVPAAPALDALLETNNGTK